ncbi:MAG TPA: regulatory protein RecX [Patescibacteria group bacterium]|nr:regulatory protein RecX [Patescibacteria group bacterium]
MISRKDPPHASIKAAAVRLLSRRSLSTAEIRMRLREQGYDEADTEQCILDFTRRGYLDDAALCATLVDKYSRQGKYSRQETSQKLYQRKLPAQLIKEALMSWSVDDEWQQGLTLLQKRFGGKKKTAELPQLLRYLASRGYAAASVRRAVEAFTQTTVESLEE